MQNKYNVYGDFYARLVNESDAEFINDIRNDKQLSRFISYVENDVYKQIEWIKKYKDREQYDLEYYYIIENTCGRKFGTVRLYNFDNNKYENGSWVFLKNSPHNISIRSDIWVRELAFDSLGFEINKFEVRKKNKKVLLYHNLWNPKQINEDELNYYFELTKDKFYEKISYVRKIFGIND